LLYFLIQGGKGNVEAVMKKRTLPLFFPLILIVCKDEERKKIKGFTYTLDVLTTFLAIKENNYEY
jgi:hypothetical protein